MRPTPPGCRPQMRRQTCLRTGTARFFPLMRAQVRPRRLTTRRAPAAPPPRTRSLAARQRNPTTSLAGVVTPLTSWPRSFLITNGTSLSRWWERAEAMLSDRLNSWWAPKIPRSTWKAWLRLINQAPSGLLSGCPLQWVLWGTSLHSPRSTFHRRPLLEKACTGSALASGSAPCASPTPLPAVEWRGLCLHTWHPDWCQCFPSVRRWNHTPSRGWSEIFLTFRAKRHYVVQVFTRDSIVKSD